MAIKNDLVTTKEKHPLIRWKQYNTLIKEQVQIGWKQLKYRQFSLQQHECQQQYKTKVYSSIDQGTLKWLRIIVKAIWTFAKTRWLARCNKNFGTKESTYSLY
eukprot:9526359-Ditylum_brightwellii.AAC.1